MSRLTMIDGRWPLYLTEHRAIREEWPWWEATRLAHMNHRMTPAGTEPPPTVFDIGAEEGDLPALWHSWGWDVVLVEPNSRVWPSIRDTWEANGFTPRSAVVAFCGEKEQTVVPERWYWYEWPPEAYGPLIPDHAFLHLWESAHRANTTTIDLLTATYGPPQAITMDVEGSELRVLRGARQTLVEHRPLVWVSVHPEFMADLYGDSADDLFALMRGFGYREKFLTTDHEQHWFFDPQ